MRAVFLDYATVNLAADLDPATLARSFSRLELRPHTAPGEIPQVLSGVEAALVNKLSLTRETIRASPALRLVLLAATGTDNVDLDAARDHGVAVCNVRDYCTASVVQHVIGSLLMLARSLREYDALARSGAWQRGEESCRLDYPIRELTGRRLGIVGHGTLGRGVAAAAEALGMDVIVASLRGDERHPGRVALDELLPTLDVLSLHCPLTPATAGLIDARRLSLLPARAILVNTARGGLVDAPALADALRQGRLGGAVIDVLAQEPPVDGDPLLAPDLPNLVVTPHIAWAAREARQRCLEEMAANALDFQRGGRRGRVV